MAAETKMPLGVFTSIGAGLGAGFDTVKELGVETVQVHAPPPEFLNAEHARKVAARFADAGIEISLVFCGFPGESYADIPAVRETIGLVPAETRGERVELMKRIADFTGELGAPGVGIHIGFVSEDHQSAEFAELVAVLQGMCDYCAEQRLRIHLETGQESADTLLAFIRAVDRENLAVNFDPANMILYGSGEPLEALRMVGRYVRSCHCKDAVWSDNPGVTWGLETPLGEGSVGIEEFLKILLELGYSGPLTIEREVSGEQQVRDIKMALGLLRTLKDKLGVA